MSAIPEPPTIHSDPFDHLLIAQVGLRVLSSRPMRHWPSIRPRSNGSHEPETRSGRGLSIGKKAPADGEHELQGQGIARADRHAHGSGAGAATLTSKRRWPTAPPGIPRRPAPVPALGWNPAASPDVLATYLVARHRSCRGRLQRWLVSLGRAHAPLRAGPTDQDRVGENHLQGIRRRHGRPQRQVAPLVRDELVALLATLDDSLHGQHNRALLFLGFAGALRRSELVGLQRGDLQFRPPV